MVLYGSEGQTREGDNDGTGSTGDKVILDATENTSSVNCSFKWPTFINEQEIHGFLFN